MIENYSEQKYVEPDGTRKFFTVDIALERVDINPKTGKEKTIKNKITILVKAANMTEAQKRAEEYQKGDCTNAWKITKIMEAKLSCVAY